MQNIAFEKKVPPPPQLQELTTMIALRLAASPSKCNKSNSYTIAEGKLNGLLVNGVVGSKTSFWFSACFQHCMALGGTSNGR